MSAVLFALVHEGATASVWGFADLVVFAVALSVVTLRTGGLEAALALHLVHNSVCWVVTPPTARPTPSPTTPRLDPGCSSSRPSGWWST